MPTIVPWIVPPDYLGAMRSGASIGLQARQEDLAQERAADEKQQAADRLKLAYSQLASEERRASEQAQTKLQLAEASLALKEQGMNMMNQYRTSLADMREKELGLKQSRGEALDAYRKERMDKEAEALDLRRQLGESTAQARSAAQALKESQFEQRQGESKYRTVGGNVIQINPDGSVTQIYPAPEAKDTSPEQPTAFQRWWKSLWSSPQASPAAGTTTSTNAPAAMALTNAVPTSATNMVAPAAKTVRVVSPDGKAGSIPAEQLDEALKAGYTRE